MTLKGTRKPDAHTVASPRQIAALLHKARETGPQPYLLFSLQYLLGLRVGEVILLREEHLGRTTVGGVGFVNVPTLKKGDSTRGGIGVCPATGKPLFPVPILSHPAMVLAAFDPAYRPCKSPWLFPGDGGNDPTRHMSRSYAIQLWHRLREEAYLPDYLSTHCLRNSAATRLFEKCERRRVVSAFLRHSFDGRRGGEDGAAVTERYIRTALPNWARWKGALDLPPLAPMPGAI